jgi:hypothetical protein
VSTSAPERVGLPHLLDQLAPLLGRDAARLVSSNVDHLHGVALGLHFFVRLPFRHPPAGRNDPRSWLDDPFPDYDTEPVMAFSAT